MTDQSSTAKDRCIILKQKEKTMRFELIIDKDKEECITAVVHSPGKLTDAIEQLVLQ